MLRVTCLVPSLVQARMAWAESGLSLLIHTDRARALVDKGMSRTVLMHNRPRALGLELQPLNAIFLSHGHSDHTGGLTAVLDAMPGVRVVAHPNVFEERFVKEQDRLVGIGCPLSRTDVEARSNLILSAKGVEVAPGMWSTGQIARQPFEVSSSSSQLVRVDGRTEQDSYMDDMSLVVETRTKPALVLGCCHAGLLNVPDHVKQVFRGAVRAIVGVTPLGGASDERLDSIANVLRKEHGSPLLVLNHCTSPEVVFRLQPRLGADRVKYPSAQSVLDLLRTRC